MSPAQSPAPFSPLCPECHQPRRERDLEGGVCKPCLARLTGEKPKQPAFCPRNCGEPLSKYDWERYQECSDCHLEHEGDDLDAADDDERYAMAVGK